MTALIDESPVMASRFAKSLRGSFAFLTILFFVMMLTLPTAFQLQRGVLLAVLCSVGIIAANIGWVISREILWLSLITIIAGTVGLLLGHLNGAPGATRVSTVYLLWPLVYLFFIGLATSPRTIVLFEKAILFGVATASLMVSFLLVGAIFGQADVAMQLLAFQGAGVSLYDGFTEMSLFSLSTVIYGLPFSATLFFSPRSQGWLKGRGWIGLLLLFVLAICALSGRRAFWLLAILTPFIVWGLYILAGITMNKRYLFIVALFVVLLAFGGAAGLALDIDMLSEQFRSAFDFSGEQSASLRYQQFVALISGWSDSPLIGHGLGAVEKSIIRSDEMPWAYELSYVSLLFQVGLIGFLIYAFAVAWIFVAGLKIVRAHPDSAQIILPLLAGLAGILLVNATNPYLTKFDYMWTIFLPVAAINVYRVGKWT
jgi:O-antigen ligase